MKKNGEGINPIAPLPNIPVQVNGFRLEKIPFSEMANMPADVVERLSLRAGDIAQSVHFEDFFDFRKINYPDSEYGYLAFEKPNAQDGFVKQSVFLIDAKADEVTGDIEMQYILSKEPQRELDDPIKTPFVFWMETRKSLRGARRIERGLRILNAIAGIIYKGETLHSGRINLENRSTHRVWEYLASSEVGEAEIVKLVHGGERIAFKKKKA